MNTNIKDFLNEHVVSDYKTGSSSEDLQSVSFKIDNAEYYMLPFYRNEERSYPAGYHVFLKTVNVDEFQQLFSYYSYYEHMTNNVSDRYTKAYYIFYKEVKDNFFNAKPQEYIPYCIYRMISECFLQDVTLPYWTFFEQIYSDIFNREHTVEDIRKCIDDYVKALKASHPWMRLGNDEWILFRLIVEHFLRWANVTQNKQYIVNMSGLLDFIQTRTVNDFRSMIRSYPDMSQDNLNGRWFDNAIHNLRMETSLWVCDNKSEGIGINDSVLIDKQRQLELFAAKLGIYFNIKELLSDDKDRDLLYYSALQSIDFDGTINSKPSIEEIKAQITSSYYGKNVTFINTNGNWPIVFYVPYEERLDNQRFDAQVIYDRYDEMLGDNIKISLIPKYIRLNEERVCWITKEVLQNGFKILACERDLNPEKPYDTGWIFLGNKKDSNYVNNPDNLVMINFNAFLNICPNVEDLMDSFSENPHYQKTEQIMTDVNGNKFTRTTETIVF